MSNKTFFGILLGSLAVYLTGMRIDVMEVDAAQYAEMSYEMLITGNFFQVFNLGQPYLDKPPLLFWLNTLSFFLFGISNFSYKLPSLLFALLAIYSTYRLAQLYYEENIARLSAVVLATSQALFLITNDVRTDTMLMGAVALSIWQWAKFFEKGKSSNLIGGSIAIGLALLAKGPIGVIATGAAIVPHLLLKKKWQKLFDFRLLLSLVIVGAMLLPMCGGLYQQWGTKGLRFFFWTQSFGRITGESEWNNHPDPLFLVHTSAWAIAPWTTFFFVGWICSIYTLIKMRFVSWSQREFISVFGFTLILIALSLSKYQLPHYIFVVFPLAAIVTANYLVKQHNKNTNTFYWLQVAVGIALLTVAVFLQYAFVQSNAWALATLLVLVTAVIVVQFKQKDVVVLSVSSILAFNLLLSSFYFPAILKYQPTADFGRYVYKHKTRETGFAMYHTTLSFSTVFYSQQLNIPVIWNFEDLSSVYSEYNRLLLFSDEYGLYELKENGQLFTVIEERKTFPVSTLNWKFLNPATRNDVCQKLYLISLSKNQ